MIWKLPGRALGIIEAETVDVLVEGGTVPRIIITVMATIMLTGLGYRQGYKQALRDALDPGSNV